MHYLVKNILFFVISLFLAIPSTSMARRAEAQKTISLGDLFPVFIAHYKISYKEKEIDLGLPDSLMHVENDTISLIEYGLEKSSFFFNPIKKSSESIMTGKTIDTKLLDWERINNITSKRGYTYGIKLANKKRIDINPTAIYDLKDQRYQGCFVLTNGADDRFIICTFSVFDNARFFEEVKNFFEIKHNR